LIEAVVGFVKRDGVGQMQRRVFHHHGGRLVCHESSDDLGVPCREARADLSPATGSEYEDRATTEHRDDRGRVIGVFVDAQVAVLVLARAAGIATRVRRDDGEGSVLVEGSIDHVAKNEKVIDVYLGR
jgi:hypothetical protein